MNEKLLQFIWQHKYFNFRNLKSVEGEDIQILYVGHLNKNQGPDFLEAKIQISNTILVGHIELHILSSDWITHHHSADSNYDNVILHVVWNHDQLLNRKFPTIELQPLVSSHLLEYYSILLNNQNSPISCKPFWNQVSDMVWNNWLDRILIERLEKKQMLIHAKLHLNNNDWAEVFWQMIARNFGIKVNADAFEEIACTLSNKILSKLKHNTHSIEALLFGQANMLSENSNKMYEKTLYKEYDYLRNKYQLKPIHTNIYLLRMRPSNFPTIRISQLADLISQHSFLFSKILEVQKVKDIFALFQVQTSKYWESHYLFGKQSEKSIVKKLGKDMIENIIINTIIPIVFAYGKFMDNDILCQKSIFWYSEIKAEKNHIVELWKSNQRKTENAANSQAYIQLYKEYCLPKRCLDCAVGSQILKPLAK